MMHSLICEYTDAMNIVGKVASNFLFRLNVGHMGRMNTQVRLLNSLVRFEGRVNSELVRNTEWMIREPGLCNFHSSTNYTKSKHIVKCLTFFSFPLVSESQNVACQNRSRIA